MNIDSLLEGLKHEIIGGLDQNIDYITFDSRDVKEGSAFVARKGYELDGHKYIPSAIENGAKLVVCEVLPENASSFKGVCFVRVDDARDALALLSHRIYGEPSRKLDVVGITGTNGKTSITYILEEIYKEAKVDYGVFGTVNIRYANKVIPAERSTPESSVINYHMREMLKSNTKLLTMEVTSHAMELLRVKYIDFKYGIFTNLSLDHLDFHKDVESYYQAKKKLFNQSQKCIINIDNEYGKRLMNELATEGKTVLSYGIDTNADLVARNPKLSADGSSFDLYYQGAFLDNVFVSVPGKIYIENFLAAILMALDYGISLKDIKSAVAKVQIEGRVVSIKNNLGLGLILDFAHTPDALENVLSTVKEFTKGRLITVFGCGGDRDASKRPKMGEVATRISDFSIVTSDNPRSEDPQKIISDILKGIKKENYDVQVDRRTAIRQAIGMAVEGDVIVVAGKGHETYQIVGDEKLHFDDSEEIMKAIGGTHD